jgi:hypothetical protein
MVMNSLAVALAATPGPPVGTLPLDAGAALAPWAGILFALTALAGIILLLARDERRLTRLPTLRPEIEIEDRPAALRTSA